MGYAPISQDGSRRQAYLVPATGRLEAAGAILETWSGAAVRNVYSVAVSALEDSELRFAIDRAFRRDGIEISFPQHDVHLKDLDRLGQLFAAKRNDSAD